MTDFESWLALFMFRHPLLASEVEIIPGVRARDLVVSVARAAWDVALGHAVADEPASLPARPELPEPTATPSSESAPAPKLARRFARRFARTPEQRERLSENARRRWEAMTPEQRQARVESMRAGRKSATKMDAAIEALSAI